MSYAKGMQSSVDTGLASTLRISVMRLARRLRAERTTEGLTMSQTSVLGILDRDGPQSPTQLAYLEKVQPPSITRIVGALEALGLVCRVPHASDRRQCVIELTEPGQELLVEDRNRREAWLARSLDELPEADREALRAAAPVIDMLADL